MALNLGELYIKVNARTGGLSKGERQVGKFVNKSEGGFNRVSKAAKRMGYALAASLSVDLLRRTILLADDYKVLENRIRTATEKTGDFAKVNAELFNVAQRTGTSLKTQVTLFQSLARSSAELGATNADILKVNETLSQLGIIGGSTQEELNNGFRQLSQAFAGGVLRAEELNSVLENIPEVGAVIAQEMGMTIGEFRKAVLEGEITSDALFAALQSAADETQARFAKLAPTIGQATTRMSNAWGKFLTQVNNTTGATGGLAKIIVRIADFLSGDFTKPIALAKDLFGGVWGVVSALWEVLKQVVNLVTIVPRALFKGGEAGGNLLLIFKAVLSSITFVLNVIAQVIGAIVKVGEAVWGFILEPFKRTAQFILDAYFNVAMKIQEFFLSAFEFIAEAASKIPFLQGFGEGLQTSIDKIREEMSAFKERREALWEDEGEAAAQGEVAAQRKDAEVEADNERGRVKVAAEAVFGKLTLKNLKKFGDDKHKTEADAVRKQLAMAASTSKELFAINKAASLATAIVNGYAAVVSSFKFGSEIGGPIVGGIFAAISLAATAAQIGQIRGQSFSGGRAAGGQVSPRGMYRVNENGPEMLSIGGKDYLMMGGSGGNVTANKNMRGGGGQVSRTVIHLHTLPGETVRHESQQDKDGETIRLFVETAETQIAAGIRSGNSPVAQSVEGTYGLNRAGGNS